MIWFALLIPVAAIIILAVAFTRKMVWWEYLLMFGIPVMAIALGKAISVSSQNMDTEFWNSYVVNATYEEPWNEYIHRTCTRSYPCGKNQTCTQSYDCSYVDYHPARWWMTDNLGETHFISKAMFEALCRDWANRVFVDRRRAYHSIDGDAYTTTYPAGDFDKLLPLCIKHRYENRVQCSKSLFNFMDIDSLTKAQYKLFDYPPANGLNYNPILGIKDPQASIRLQRYNGLYGSSKFVHMLILVYTDLPQTAALAQESYWRGGNKNEFILCIGRQGTKIQWAKVISWTDQHELKLEVVRKVRDLDTLNLVQVVDLMAKAVNAKFTMKYFDDFSYLKVEPTDKAVAITFIITLVLTVALAFFCVRNEWTLDAFRSRRHNDFGTY